MSKKKRSLTGADQTLRLHQVSFAVILTPTSDLIRQPMPGRSLLTGLPKRSTVLPPIGHNPPGAYEGPDVVSFDCRSVGRGYGAEWATWEPPCYLYSVIAQSPVVNLPELSYSLPFHVCAVRFLACSQTGSRSRTPYLIGRFPYPGIPRHATRHPAHRHVSTVS